MSLLRDGNRESQHIYFCIQTTVSLLHAALRLQLVLPLSFAKCV